MIPKGSIIKDLALLKTYLVKLRWRYVAGGCFLLVTNALALLIPWVMKLAVEGLQHPAATPYSPAICAGAIIGLAAVHCITRIYSRTLMLNAARIIEFRIRNHLFERLMQLDQLFFSTIRTGDILSRFSNDLTNVRMLTGFGIMSAVNTLIIYSATIVLMLNIHPWLTLWAILPFPLMVLIVKKISYHLFQRSLEAQEELARLTSLTEEAVSSIRLIKSYCREVHFQEEFGTTADRYLGHNLRLARLRGLVIPVMAAATGASTLVLLFMGGRFVIAGSMSLGDFVAFSGYLAMLVWPTAVMGWILTLAQRGAASMSRLATILNAQPAVDDREDAVPLDEQYSEIELRGATFNYGSAAVLKDISLTIRKGEKIGITGPVGSGKTTLLKLLPRLLPIENGQLFIGKQDITGITLDSLRRQIGYVPQEAFLFSRTIRDNITYGQQCSHDEGIWDSVRQAGFSDDVNKLHQGLDTMVGERGVTLSGGQKQRAAIARALASNPPILLLDDPLSAVDAGREEEILAELGNFFAQRTVLIVSQRVSAFRDCDRIIVMEQGRIVEEGTQDQLLARNGLFAEMNRRQRLQAALEE